MCCRVFQITAPGAIADLFSARDGIGTFTPRYNVGPTRDLPVLRINPNRGTRHVDALHWGLVPSWARDASQSASCVNARAETLSSKPSFRDAFARRRCIVPIDGFYEWQHQAGQKLPYAFARTDRSLMLCAGIWEFWQSAGTTIRSVAIVTTDANADVAPIHHRMPLILEPDQVPAWLGESPATSAELHALMIPCQTGILRSWRVARDVGNVRNDAPTLLDELPRSPAAAKP